MNTEQKAAAYDEAKKWMESIYPSLTHEQQMEAEAFFPELAESEDEKIRKELIEHITLCSESIPERASMLAWLEKQGKQNDVETNIEFEDFVRWFVKQRTDDYRLIPSNEDIKKWSNMILSHAAKVLKIQKQKPLEWSEEDKENYKSLEKLLNEASCYSCTEGSNKILNWLKSLKNRCLPQPKQEWTKEDIEMIDWLIRCCETEHKELCNDKYGHQDIVSDLKRDCRKKRDWLESLKGKVVPQKQWKPSEEQMDCLKEAADNYPNPDVTEALYEIYRQLKEL